MPFSQPCIIIIAVLASTTTLCLSIAAITISNKYSNDQCIGIYKGISFTYGTWLFAYGITEVIGTGLLVFFSLAWFMTESYCLGLITVVTWAVTYIFQFCWYIVGSILFFQTVNGTCDDTSTIQQFGLALFIIQTIIWVLACLGGKATTE